MRALALLSCLARVPPGLLVEALDLALQLARLGLVRHPFGGLRQLRLGLGVRLRLGIGRVRVRVRLGLGLGW